MRGQASTLALPLIWLWLSLILAYSTHYVFVRRRCMQCTDWSLTVVSSGGSERHGVLVSCFASTSHSRFVADFPLKSNTSPAEIRLIPEHPTETINRYGRARWLKLRSLCDRLRCTLRNKVYGKLSWEEV